jgi:hypothetical protein
MDALAAFDAVRSRLAREHATGLHGLTSREREKRGGPEWKISTHSSHPRSVESQPPVAVFKAPIYPPREATVGRDYWQVPLMQLKPWQQLAAGATQDCPGPVQHGTSHRLLIVSQTSPVQQSLCTEQPSSTIEQSGGWHVSVVGSQVSPCVGQLAAMTHSTH